MLFILEKNAFKVLRIMIFLKSMSILKIVASFQELSLLYMQLQNRTPFFRETFIEGSLIFARTWKNGNILREANITGFIIKK